MEEKVQMEPWLSRLKDERTELLERTLRLKVHMDHPESLHNKQEWDMIQRQYYAMRDYLQALTDRCVYYGILESANLNLEYPSRPGCGR